MRTKVEFTKDFGGKKKGDVAEYDPYHANYLVKKDKVAKFYKEKKITKK